ncbi:DUF6036 family nucleotidyltransferase [Leucobacter albus]|uniref:DUF6036 family nucleotidyltransferase n=1 Tax=Leucobacter albus TaxID=272210 RepID=A0ABW3TVE1_9MICO
MNREQLLHAIRAAAHLVQLDSVIVIGSQSILGTWDENELPDVVVMSHEVDILPLSGQDTALLADRLAELGEMSRFDQTFGYHIDGVDETTAVLPDGWQNRLVPVGSYSVAMGKEVTGLCLEPHDLCVAKIIAFREKDRGFVSALVTAQLLDLEVLLERLTQTMPPDGRNLDYAYAWVLDAITGRDSGPGRPKG